MALTHYVQLMQMATPREAICISLAMGPRMCTGQLHMCAHQIFYKRDGHHIPGLTFGWPWVWTHPAPPHCMKGSAKHLIQANKDIHLLSYFVHLTWSLPSDLLMTSGDLVHTP